MKLFPRIVRLFSRKPNYSSLFNDIKKIELSNENIDSKTAVDKLELLQKLKKNIDTSKILKKDSNIPSDILIKKIYNLLFEKQGNFDTSYYVALSFVAKNPKENLNLIRSYESFLSEKLLSLRDLINAYSPVNNQNNIYHVLSSKAGLIKTSMLALMLSVATMSCNVGFNENLVLQTVNSGGHVIEYRLDKKDMETYIIKDKIANSELGNPIAQIPGELRLHDGSEEIGMAEVHTYRGEIRPYMVVLKSYDGKILSILLNKNSPFYSNLKKKFDGRIILIK